MKHVTMSDRLAEAFVAEGIDTQFVLMGDGNMHWSIAMAAHDGVQTVHVRHEHCAVAAAMSYHVATGKIAAASVTCGPGLTQIMTALPAAVRASLPLVVFAGETPINATFYNQAIDQAPFVLATGAHYISAHSPTRMLDHVREAFHTARTQRRPVVIGIPYDLQKLPCSDTAPYAPSTDYLPEGGRPYPDPVQVAKLVEKLRTAKRPVVLGGRGVLQSGARGAIVALADRCGALLCNTLPMRGLFDDHAFSIGVAGGYSSDLAREVLGSVDFVLVFGASLTYYTKENGKLFDQAFVAQVDTGPKGLRDGMKSADLYITADAKAAAEIIHDELGDEATAAEIRTDELLSRIADEVADQAEFHIEPGVVDPRAAIRALDDVIPKDWDIVSGSGHQGYFNSQMRGRFADRFTAIREFGAIGNGLPFALGVAAARRRGAQGKIALIEGDGGFLMHIQELETLKRHGFRVLLCILNDGAFGSEIHKLRAEGIDDSEAVFGRPPFEDIARGFGIRGVEVRDLSQLPELFAAFEAQGESEVWNIQISDQVTAPSMRKIIARGHGVM